jgi:hypothetical protein
VKGADRKLGLALTVLGVVLFPVLLWRGWGGWNDVLVDFGRELYVPWRLSEGEVLYRDIAYFNGPLSAYFNAAAFSLFGASLRGLTILNALLIALTGWLLHRRVESVGGPLAAGASLVAFLVIFACGHFPGLGNYNFLAPYSHELTHGLLLGLAAYGAAVRGSAEGGERWAAGAGLLLGLVFLTKAEVMIGAGGAVGLLFLLRWKSKGSARRAGLLITGGLVAPVAACTLLSMCMPFGEALRGTLGSWVGILGSDTSQGLFYQRAMGLDAPGQNVGDMFTSLGYALLVLVPALVIDHLARKKTPRVRLCLAGLAAAVALAIVTTRSTEILFWFHVARFLPLFALGAFVFATVQARRAGAPGCALWSERAGFALFGLLMMAKILLVVTVAHYGFALALVGGLVFLVVALEWLPTVSGESELRGVVLRGATLGALLGAVFGFWSLSGESFAQKTVTVGSGADAFRSEPVPPRAQGVNLLMAEIETRMGPDQTLLVLPEGIMINYLARRPTPTRHINFMPPELELFGEEEILADLRAQPAAALALVHKDTSEYGFPLFGIDYGEKIIRWAQRRYQYDWSWGEQPLQPGTRFGVGLLAPK